MSGNEPGHAVNNHNYAYFKVLRTGFHGALTGQILT